MDKYIGRRLDGRYEILEMIGSGGMANVYRAHDRLENTDVAVKILREEFLGNEDFVRRFKNESKAISLLSHPNIVKVYDVNFSDSVQCIVMELIDGITLKEYIDRQGQLGWRDAVFFTEQILKALQHAHDRGIVHRDIKPQNIMLLTDGTIKVMDFGIARFSRSETRTITDKAIGSVHYISPEQAKGDTTDAKADIYSTGVMLYEMLTGKLPFESDSPVSVAIKQISDTPQSMREVDSTIPQALEEITFKAMAKDPTKRYQSASQMLRDIEEFKRNPSIKFAYKYMSSDAPTKYVETAKSVRPTPPAPKSVKKKRRGVAFLVTTLSIIFACLIGTVILVYMVFNGVFVDTEDVKLPSFIGMNINDIKKNAEYQFKWDIEEVYDTKVGLGVVIDQTPSESMTIKANGTVKLKVSKGIESVTVPQVKGLPWSDAAQLLRERKLVVSLVLQANDSVSEGQAYMTDPESGTKLDAGSLVTLYFNPTTGGSTGETYMVEVVGMTLTDASKVLQFNRIRIKEIIYAPSDAEKGRVIGQDIPGRTLVPISGGVTLTVSEGSPDKPFDWSCKLPYSVGGDTSYELKVVLNGNEIYVTTIKDGPTNQDFNLSGTGEGVLVVLVNGSVLYELRFQFETGERLLMQDNSGSFVMNKPAAVDKTDLNNAIAEAQGLVSGIVIDVPTEACNYITNAEKAAIDAALAAAVAVRDNPEATQETVNNARNALRAVMNDLPHHYDGT